MDFLILFKKMEKRERVRRVGTIMIHMEDRPLRKDSSVKTIIDVAPNHVADIVRENDFHERDFPARKYSSKPVLFFLIKKPIVRIIIE